MSLHTIYAPPLEPGTVAVEIGMTRGPGNPPRWFESWTWDIHNKTHAALMFELGAPVVEAMESTDAGTRQFIRNEPPSEES